MERKSNNNHYQGGNKQGNGFKGSYGNGASQDGFQQAGHGRKQGGQQKFTGGQRQYQQHGTGYYGGGQGGNNQRHYEGGKGGYYNHNPESFQGKPSYGIGAPSSRPQTSQQTSTRKQSDPFSNSGWCQEETKVTPQVPRLATATTTMATASKGGAGTMTAPMGRSPSISNDESTYPSSGRSGTSTGSGAFSMKPMQSSLT
jgi:hypothetical protein